jgi:Tol biopolymer transport system component
MALTAGTKLGPYEIQDKLGAGGMGEVYRARDTRLDRTVAIKVLSAHLSSDPDLKVRFQREARAISALQHPHICVLHDVGSQDDVDYLVMEFLEGETLASRLGKGALPLDQLVKIGADIADALDKAHRAGIVHRDLKPGNIMLTKSGAKLLDFGLAKPLTITAAGSSNSTPLLSAALTISSPSPQNSPLTSAGSIVGTMQYMAPEQLQGKEADARTDVFAFGALLYEMATGQRAFAGKSQLSVATAILENDPAPVSSVQPALPAALDAIVATCLAKDPEERFASAHDVGIALKWVGKAAITPGSPPAAEVGGRRPRLLKVAWALAAILLLLLAATTVSYWRLRHQPQPGVMRSFLIPPDKADPNGRTGYSAMSPDGTRWAVVAPDAMGAPVLWVRPLDSLTAQALAGTDDALDPFWSPDSRSIAFFAQGKLKRVDASGGPTQTICDAPVGRGGSWSQEGTILFKLAGSPTLLRVQAQGGTPGVASELDASQQEDSHNWPWFLPDGRHYIFFVYSSTPEYTGIALGSLDSKQHRFLFRNDSNAVYASGYLVYVSGGYLLAQKFDVGRLEPVGEAVRIAEQVSSSIHNYHGTFAVSQTGTLLYFRGAGGGSQLTLRDRSGKPLGVAGPPARYIWPRVSPDGKQLAVGIEEDVAGRSDIWLLNFERGTRTRLTFDPGYAEDPAWAPDGTKIFYSSRRLGQLHIYAKLANGAGAEETILNTPGVSEDPSDISSDERYLAYDRTEGQRRGIWILPLFGDRKPFPLVQNDFIAAVAKFSPDGKFVAYLANETGRWELYITPFPGGGAKWQVSEHGGNVPVWRGDGKELYYQSGNDLVAVEVREAGAGVELGNPQRLFGISPVSGPAGPYDLLARDGSKFLINASPELSTPDPPVLITNWPEELKGSRQ